MMPKFETFGKYTINVDQVEVVLYSPPTTNHTEHWEVRAIGGNSYTTYKKPKFMGEEHVEI